MAKKHIEKYKLISKSIVEIRKKKKITQAEFADLLGVSKSYISKIEAPNLEKKFSLEILFDMEEVLGVSVKEFFRYF